MESRCPLDIEEEVGEGRVLTSDAWMTNTPECRGAARVGPKLGAAASFPFFTGRGLEDSDFLFFCFTSLQGSNLMSATAIREKCDDQMKIKSKKI